MQMNSLKLLIEAELCYGRTKSNVLMVSSLNSKHFAQCDSAQQCTRDRCGPLHPCNYSDLLSHLARATVTDRNCLHTQMSTTIVQSTAISIAFRNMERMQNSITPKLTLNIRNTSTPKLRARRQWPPPSKSLLFFFRTWLKLLSNFSVSFLADCKALSASGRLRSVTLPSG